MYRLNLNTRAVALLLCLPIVLTTGGAFAAPPDPVIVSPIADFAVDEDSSPNLFDLDTVFGDSEPLVYVAASSASEVVAFVAGSTLSLSYQSDWSGTADITVRADEEFGAGSSPDMVFTVTVNAINDNPIIVAPIADQTLIEDQTAVVFDLTTVFDDDDFGTPEGENHTYTLAGNTMSGVLTADVTGSTLTLTLIGDENGTGNVAVQVTDKLGAFKVDSFQVTVDPSNDPVFEDAGIADQVVDEDSGTIVIPMAGVFGDIDFDHEGDNLTFDVAGNTAAGVVDVTPGATSLTLDLVEDANGGGTITIEATDEGGATAQTSFNVTVDPQNDSPIQVGAPTVPTVSEDGNTFVVTLTDVFEDPDEGDGDTFRVFMSNATPGGLITGATELTSLDGAITFTYPAEVNGTANITLTVEDALLETAEVSFDVTIDPVNDPVFEDAGIADQVMNEDQGNLVLGMSGVFGDVDFDHEGDNLTYAIVGNTISAVADVSVTPTALTIDLFDDANGTGTITVEATDEGGATAQAAFGLQVLALADGPQVVVAPVAPVVNEDDGSFGVDMTGVFDDADLPSDSHRIFLSAVTPAGYISGATELSSLNGTMVFDVPPNVSGTVNITVTAEDSDLLTAATSFSVNIIPSDDAPTVENPIADQVVPEDSGTLIVPLSGVFDDVDFEFEGDTWEDIQVSASGGAFIESLDVSFSSVQVVLKDNQHGDADITVTLVDDAGLNLTAADTFNLSVTPVPDDPFVVDAMGTLTMLEDDPNIQIDLREVFDDIDIETDGEALSFSIAATAGNLSVFDDLSITGGILNIDLAPDAFDEGGIDVTVRATDSQPAFVDDVLKIIVNEVRPLAVDDAVSLDEDSGVVVIDVLANDDPGDPTVSIIQYGVDKEGFTNVSESDSTTQLNVAGTEETLPNGSMSLDGGVIIYEPKENFSGTDFFTYTIQDGDGDTSTATVTINVLPTDDAPRIVGSPTYTVTQGSFLSLDAEEGLLSWVIDDDGDSTEVILVNPPDSSTYETFSVNTEDGSFEFTPKPEYGDDPDEGPITFSVYFWDEDDSLLNGPDPIEVTIFVDAVEEEIAQAPPGEVEFDFDLSDVPLEDAISSEANVLIVMDDSGSMDWGMMTDQTDGIMFLSNANVRDSNVNSYSYGYYYLYPLNTNVYGTYYYNLPTEEGLSSNPDMNGNDYGVWRARNSQFNSIYYDPAIRYRPWIGLNRDSEDFEDVDPTAAPLDPFDVNAGSNTIDLTDEYTYTSRRVPIVHYDGSGSRSRENVVNSNVYYPYYYTTSVEGKPDWDDPHTKVEIRDTSATYSGGPDRVDCALDDGDPLNCTYEQELQNFANWFSYYRLREYTAKAALGFSVADASNLRMGYAVLNKSSEREPIDSLNGSYRVGHKKDLMDELYDTPSGGGTPLRSALDKAGRHFECVAGDSFGSTSSSNPGDAACPVLASPEGQCQNNYTLLFSDGTWNGYFNGSADANHDAESGPSDSEFDGGMFEGSHSGSLADVAMYYYERDLHDLEDGVPTTARDLNGADESAFSAEGELMHQHMKTYTVGFGVTGNVTFEDLPTDYTQSFDWSNPYNGGKNKIDDMLHAAVNGRGQFLQANNPVLLSAAFQKAFADFAEGSVSVSAVSFNSTSLREDLILFNGTFNLRNQSGDLIAVPLDIDTGEILNDQPEWSAAERLDAIDPDNRVIVTWDRVGSTGIPFRFDSLNTNQLATMSEDEVNFIRGERDNEEPLGLLRARAEEGGLLGDIVHSAPRFVGPPRALRRNQEPYPVAVGDRYGEFVDAYENRRRVVYVGANDGMLHGFDAGTSIEDVGTGDELVAYVPNKFMDATQRFSSDLDELTSLVYSHKFYVDVTPETDDVFMLPQDGAISREWTTVLIGALGAGGKGYYALNITDPDSDYVSESAADDIVMWEFTDADDTPVLDVFGNPIIDLAGEPVKDLGYTFSQAQIAMTNVDDGSGNKRWAAFFGNGYNSTAGIAKLFTLFIEGGLDGTWSEWNGTSGDFLKLTTGAGVKPAPDPLAGLPNGLGTPTLVDSDRNGTVDRIYAGDLFGTLYRFDISSADPDEWTVTPIFRATFDETDDTRQPITTRPVVFFNEPSGYLVVFGTGSYITEEDGTSQNIQSVYGIWDRNEVVPQTLASDTKSRLLVEQTITNKVDESLGDRGNLRVSSQNAVQFEPASADSDGVYGWYIDFDMERAATTEQGNPNPDTSGSATGPQFPGERAIRRIVVVGDAIVLTTVIPRNENSCLRAPPGAIMPVDWRTGGAPLAPVLDLNNDGLVNDEDLIGDPGIGGGFLIPPENCFGSDCEDQTTVSSDVSLITDGSEGLLCTSSECIAIEVLLRERTGRLSWRELPNMVE